MMSAIKRLLYDSLSLEGYLRLLQRGFFVMRDLGLLRLSRSFHYHYNVRRLIRRGDVILDIGANLGYYSIPFARWTGPAGTVLSVEPVPVYNDIFNELAARHPNISLYPYALGSRDGVVDMVAPLGAGYLQTGHPHVGGHGEQGLRFRAEMRNPGALFGGLGRLDYIKCDVEGYEYEVLSSMREVIARLRPKVQVEVWAENERPVMEMFREMGYSPFRLEKGRLVALADSTGDQDIIFVSDY